MPSKIASKSAGTMPSQSAQVDLNIACMGNQNAWELPRGSWASNQMFEREKSDKAAMLPVSLVRMEHLLPQKLSVMFGVNSYIFIHFRSSVFLSLNS